MREVRAKDVGEGLFGDLDEDGDNKVSLQEIFKMASHDTDRATETAKFKAADKDGDGSLDMKELMDWVFPENNPLVELAAGKGEMDRKDLDKVNALNLTECMEQDDPDMPADIFNEQKEEFDQVDANKDGKIDVQELGKWESG